MTEQVEVYLNNKILSNKSSSLVFHKYKSILFVTIMELTEVTEGTT
jgi:hypothetical protein